jgi:hypothetical protein
MGRRSRAQVAERQASDPLTLVPGALPPVLAVLRRLPLLGTLVLAPQVLHWGAPATYRIRLQAVPESICGISNCCKPLLLDAAP